MNYKRIYDSIIERSKDRLPPEGYVERHHIIPRCMGGSDDKENIAVLTPEEHFLCHVLLVKMFPEHGRLIYAVNQMGRAIRGKKRRKLYGWLKRRFSEQRKLDTKGKCNPHYGSMWIRKIDSTESKKLKKGESIPEGWIKGRIIKDKKLCPFCNKNFIRNDKNCCRERLCYVSYRENLTKNTKLETEILFKNFIDSDFVTLSQFVKNECDFSVVALHKRFCKYITGYKDISFQGKHNTKELCKNLVR